MESNGVASMLVVLDSDEEEGELEGIAVDIVDRSDWGKVADLGRNLIDCVEVF